MHHSYELHDGYFQCTSTDFVSNCCRTCGKAVPSTSRKALFLTTGKTARIAERLSTIGQIEIQEGDGLPHFCCKHRRWNRSGWSGHGWTILSQSWNIICVWLLCGLVPRLNYCCRQLTYVGITRSVWLKFHTYLESLTSRCRSLSQRQCSAGR